MKFFKSSTLLGLLALGVFFPVLSHAQSDADITGTSAQLNCMLSCMEEQNCDEDYGMGEIYEVNNVCEPYLFRCEERCYGIKSLVFGAIARDEETGALGMSNPAISRKSAIASAIEHCARNGKNCKLVESFSKICTAVSAGDDYVLVWAKGATLNEAETNARKSCKEKTKGKCVIKHSYCYQ